MPSVEWNNFSMTATDPSLGRNPVTRTLNMVKRDNGVWFKRRNFTDSIANSPENHAVNEWDGVPYLFIKEGTSVKYSSGGGFTSIVNGSGWDAPTWNATVGANPDSRGSFSLHGGELYYCDASTVFAVADPADGARRPGVPSLASLTYPQVPLFLDALGAGGFDDYHTEAGTVDVTDPAACDPFITRRDGEKTLNTSFCFSYYDPIRDIYGKRSVAHALPYIFGPHDPDGSNEFLTGDRTQFSKTIHGPSLPGGYSYLKIAVWFSPGMNIIANPNGIASTGWFWTENEWFPAMSDRMTNTFFLEGRFDVADFAGDGLACRKDDATLWASGRYVDVNDRPLPSQFMLILQSGTAIYFYPWVDESSPGEFQRMAEYSYKHPEQIGRDTDTQRETTSPIPNMRGNPVGTLSDGSAQVVLTKQGIYRVGFGNGNVQVSEVALGRGIRSLNSLTTSTVGTLWCADEGIVWMRGGQVILLDKKLGFGDWFDQLTNAEREEVVIGAADSENQLILFTNDSSNGYRAICYDYENQAVSEFSFTSKCNYAAHFRSAGGSALWAFGVGKYPSSSYGTYASSVEFWLTDDIDTPKTLRGLTVDFPDFVADGGLSQPLDISVTVTAYQHARGLGEDAASNHETFTDPGFTETISVDGAGRFTANQCMGKSGRVFKIVIAGPNSATAWGLKKVIATYDVGQSADNRST